MRVFTSPAEFQRACIEARRTGELALVPTMGYLHAGHEELLRRAARHSTSALTIFVNPSQFGPNEDLSRYPRDVEGDLRKAEACGIELVLTPKPEDVYPAGFDTWVEPGALALPLEGEHRPGHFRGVATVVLKLLNLGQPTHAYFGEKDFQQLAIIRRLVRDFDVPTEIVGVPIVREEDGLALSSRNAYLSSDERVRALSLSKGLREAQQLFDAGERRVDVLEAAAREPVQAVADRIDYVSLRDVDTLQAPTEVSGGRVVMLMAAVVGKTRLIDNAVLA